MKIFILVFLVWQFVDLRGSFAYICIPDFLHGIDYISFVSVFNRVQVTMIPKYNVYCSFFIYCNFASTLKFKLVFCFYIIVELTYQQLPAVYCSSPHTYPINFSVYGTMKLMTPLEWEV